MEQKLKREIYDVKTELEEKEQELSLSVKLNEELKQTLNHEKLLMKDLNEEIDVSYVNVTFFFSTDWYSILLGNVNQKNM